MFTGQFYQTSSLSTQETAYYKGLFETLNPDKWGYLAKNGLAKFLESSRLPENILHQVWSVVDLQDKGRFNQEMFSKACRLVAHAQNGAQDIVPELLFVEPVKLPIFFGSGITLVDTPKTTALVDDGSYRHLFEKLRVGSIIPSEAVKGLFVKSGLPQRDLAKIFDLATSGTQGVMGYGEFIVAMTLIGARREGAEVPQVLSPGLAALSQTPTPPGASEHEASRREDVLTELENERKTAITLKAHASVRDGEYYKMFDDMKRLETALSVAKTATGHWQDQILASEGRIGEIETELEDMRLPEGVEDVGQLEHELLELQTELEKVTRAKTDLRMRVQVLRERVMQRGNDTDILSTTLAADNAKLNDLRRERIRLIGKTSDLGSDSGAAPVSEPVPLVHNRQPAVRRDNKGVRVGAVSSAVVLAQPDSSTLAGWETFDHENRASSSMVLPTVRNL